MSEPINVGDLVYLLPAVNPAHTRLSGQIRTIEGPSNNVGEWILLPADYNAGVRMSWHPRRLKRLPPLSELEGQQTEETLKETA